MGSVTWQFQEERRLKWSLIWTKIYSGDLFHAACFERQGAHRPHTEQAPESSFMHRQAQDQGSPPRCAGAPHTSGSTPLDASNNGQKLYLSSPLGCDIQGLGPSPSHLPFPYCPLLKKWLCHQLPWQVQYYLADHDGSRYKDPWGLWQRFLLYNCLW